MASFVVFHMLGLYPLPGTREFLVSSPFFRTVRIRNPLLGKTTTIRVHEFEGDLSHDATNTTTRKIYIEVSGLLLSILCPLLSSLFSLRLGSRAHSLYCGVLYLVRGLAQLCLSGLWSRFLSAKARALILPLSSVFVPFFLSIPFRVLLWSLAEPGAR